MAVITMESRSVFWVLPLSPLVFPPMRLFRDLTIRLLGFLINFLVRARNMAGMMRLLVGLIDSMLLYAVPSRLVMLRSVQELSVLSCPRTGTSRCAASPKLLSDGLLGNAWVPL
jgi:hypothetical protein